MAMSFAGEFQTKITPFSSILRKYAFLFLFQLSQTFLPLPLFSMLPFASLPTS